MEDFLQLRKADSAFSAQMFESLLTLSRLVAISYGEAGATLQRWEEAKKLEETRLGRLAIARN